MQNFSKFKIGVVGLWHLGEIYSACLSELGHDVIGFGADEETVNNLNKGVPPLKEPDLEDILKKNIGLGRLNYSSDFKKIRDCDIVWLAFDTPVDKNDEIDLCPIYDFFKNYSEYFRGGALIIISSQIPVGTCDIISRLIKKMRPNLEFDVAYLPENLQLGMAVKSFLKPDRIVVGASNKETKEKIKNIFSLLKTNFLFMSAASAEMSKHALNAFLATSLSFIYDIADLSQEAGADITDVSKALRADKRIGAGAYLDAGIGFSGGTLARDLKIIANKGLELNIETPVISAVFQKNYSRPGKAISYLQKYLGQLKDKKVSIYGLTYKPGTSTLRRSLSIEIINKLKGAGVDISACDPEALQDEVRKLGIKFSKDHYICAKGSQAAIFITNWPEFKNIDLGRLKAQMSEPFIFFDTRNFFQDKEKEIRGLGFFYIGIGRAIF
ncbi:nucleotide sugar dehydrogenase [Patescibacteria group bacterium]|nr:nucleotide sugar dehydrogenase [Patescibacteria group bacterium]